MRRLVRVRIPAVALFLLAAAGSADAARRSEKQLEMDRQREEMRRQAEEKRLNPNMTLKPPVLPGSSGVFAPLVLPPPSTAASAPAPASGRAVTPVAPGGARVPDVPPPDAPASATSAPAAAAPAGEVVDEDLRKDTSFQQAAGLFNSALDLFRKFEADRNASHLATIPNLCDRAAAAFQTAGATRPGDPRIAKYIEQCYGLTRYARQSALMAPARR
jgi:hypothetical protein